MFRIGLSGDFSLPGGEARFPFLKLDGLAQDNVELVHLPQMTVAAAQSLQGLDAFLTIECTVAPSSLDNVDSLRVIGRMAAGYDDMAVSAMTERGIAYVNARRAYAKPVATAALALLLNVTTRLSEREQLMKKSPNGWTSAYNLVGTGLYGLTMGVLGPGEIGQEIMRLMTPFGMRMLATGNSVRADIASRIGFDYVDIDSLFQLSDIIIVACPLTEKTRQCVTRERLFSMKKNAFLVNVGRGQIIDEVALIDALDSNHLAGAGLDVFCEEPTHADNPLLSMANVVTSPHGLAITDQAIQSTFDEAAAGIIAVLNGVAPENLVNPETMAGNAEIRE